MSERSSQYELSAPDGTRIQLEARRPTLGPPALDINGRVDKFRRKYGSLTS